MNGDKVCCIGYPVSTNYRTVHMEAYGGEWRRTEADICWRTEAIGGALHGGVRRRP